MENHVEGLSSLIEQTSHCCKILSVSNCNHLPDRPPLMSNNSPDGHHATFWQLIGINGLLMAYCDGVRTVCGWLS